MRSKRASATKFKPPVAFESEREAQANIELKIEFLTSIVKRKAINLAAIDITDARFLELLRSLPDSKRKFNGFSTDSLANELKAGAPTFRSNASVTLRRDPELTDRVQKVLDALGQAVAELSQHPKKVVKAAGLARQLKLSNDLREIAEATIYAQKRQIEKLRNEVVSYKNKLESLRRTSEDNAGTLRQEINRLKGGATKETSTRPNVVPLPTKPARK